MKPNNGSEHKKGIGHYMYVAYSASYNALLSRYMKAIKRFIKKASYAWILLGVFCMLAGLLVMLDRELQILKETQTVWEESLEAMRVLFEAGLYMSPAVYQMEAYLAGVQSGIVDVQETILTTEAALCLMLSEQPHHIDRSQYEKFVMPSELHVGLPLRLLEARPDVRQAALHARPSESASQERPT